MPSLTPERLRADAARVAAIALAEDGANDITTEVTVPPDLIATGRIEFRSAGVLAGLLYADAVVRACGLSPIEWSAAEGDRLFGGAVIGTLHGRLATVLRAERPLLNLLQRASGIASATRAYVDAVEGTGARILHTRKTAPGLRLLRRVRSARRRRTRPPARSRPRNRDGQGQSLAGAGAERRTAGRGAAARPGRAGSSVVMWKWRARAQLEMAVRGRRDSAADRQPDAGHRARLGPAWPDRYGPASRSRRLAESTLTNVRAYAEAGVDFISIGALTHSVRAADVALGGEARE